MLLWITKGGDYPQTYENIPYTCIVEVLEEQMGGKPEHGSRNNYIYAMACHLRYICDDDPEWIAQVMPTYGEERKKWMNSIRSACQRSQNRLVTDIIRRTLDICRQRLEASGNRTAETDAPPPIPDKLPALIELLVSRTPEIYRPAVAHAVFPPLATHLRKTYFRYIDNVMHEATLIVRWSLKYDLWCKMQFFGEAIENMECNASEEKRKHPQNLLDLLPPYNVQGYGRLARLLEAMTVMENGISPVAVDTEAIRQGYEQAFPDNAKALVEWLGEGDEYAGW